jgi:hypothetical protein
VLLACGDSGDDGAGAALGGLVRDLLILLLVLLVLLVLRGGACCGGGLTGVASRNLDK